MSVVLAPSLARVRWRCPQCRGSVLRSSDELLGAAVLEHRCAPTRNFRTPDAIIADRDWHTCANPDCREEFTEGYGRFCVDCGQP